MKNICKCAVFDKLLLLFFVYVLLRNNIRRYLSSVPIIFVLPFIGGRNSFNLPSGNVDTEIERPEYSFLWPTQYWGKIF